MNHQHEKNTPFLISFLSTVRENENVLSVSAQPEYLSTYWPRLNAELHGWIDWNWPTGEIERFVCAFDEPYEGAKTRWRGKIVRLRDVISQTNEPATHKFQHGMIFRNNAQWLTVAARGGELIVPCIENNSGKNLLDEITVGERFSTPPEDLLDTAKHVIYTPDKMIISQ